MVSSIIEQSILHKAIEKNLVKFDLVDLRDFGLGNYKQIDDTPYGGGGGMILMPEPLFVALDQILNNLKDSNNVKMACKNSMSPTIIKSPDDESFLSVIMPLRVEW